MRPALQRLRLALLTAATLLLCVLLGYFFVARWRDRLLRRDLPRRLGINIQQDSSGFTLSKSEHGKTLFTLHAGRVVQMKDQGDAQLDGVSIVLYGQGASQREDRIRGDHFSYDPKTQIVTAIGSVAIDLQSPATAQNPAARGIHVLADGLAFDQKNGRATTSGQVEFHLAQAWGTALGADYDSARGLITLQSQVTVHAVFDGGPATLTAEHAVLNREDWQIHLNAANLVTQRREARALRSTIWLRPDSSVDHMLAEGAVTMTNADGTTVNAPRVFAQFDAASKVQHVHAEAGVTMHQPQSPANSAERTGSAQQVWVEFNPESKPTSLRALDHVQINETPANGPALERTLHAGELRVAFRNGVAQTAVAKQSPQVLESQLTSGNLSSKTLQADTLSASLRNGRALKDLHGEGNTLLTQHDINGEADVSRGDHLRAHFSAAANSASQIVEAVQQGNVTFKRTAPARSGSGEQLTTGHADQAHYRQASETVLLTGSPRISNADPNNSKLDISAQSIAVQRISGDATADGSVKGTLLNSPDSDPTHVVAAHAVSVHSSQTVTFTGKPRLWQASNSIEAPVITITQRPQGLIAESSADGTQLVHCVLANQNQHSKQPQQPARVTARKLVYSDADHRARFTKAVTLVDANGTVRADTVDVFLKPASGDRSGAFAGNLDHLVATGDVFLTQPQRQGTGQELVYTAQDGLFVLTGSAGRPPRVEDRLQGTVSGETLQFQSGSERVDVISGNRRTVTTTHLAK